MFWVSLLVYRLFLRVLTVGFFGCRIGRSDGLLLSDHKPVERETENGDCADDDTDDGTRADAFALGGGVGIACVVVGGVGVRVSWWPQTLHSGAWPALE